MRVFVAALALLLPAAAQAATLEVGPGRAFDRPSAAAAKAQAGDTVTIAPGEYFDCAVWRADNLTVAGESGGAGVTITDDACYGKAGFIIDGNGITIRNITFARMRVPDDNGAGIRDEARDLTVQDSRFVNDQVGILGSTASGGFLRVIGCTFRQNGVSLNGRTNFSVIAGGYALVRIERSDFAEARAGGHIAVSAERMELVGDRLADEGGHMTGPMVTVTGGALLLQDNTVEIAPGAALRPGVVLATGDVTSLELRGNTLREPAGTVPLLRNWTGQPVTASGNTVPPGVAVASDVGATYHRLRATAARFRDALHELYRRARHVAAVVVHGMT